MVTGLIWPNCRPELKGVRKERPYISDLRGSAPLCETFRKRPENGVDIRRNFASLHSLMSSFSAIAPAIISISNEPQPGSGDSA